MGSIKIIIAIIVLVIWIAKTIMGDAKQDEARKRKAQSKPRPKPRPAQVPLFPPDPIEEEIKPAPNFLDSPYAQSLSYAQETPKNETPSPIFEKPMEAQSAIDEEQRKAHIERWRRALIDSEILKRKF